MQARYYDPNLGRFLSADPEKARPGDVYASNRFAYAKNSPMVFTDPTGRCIEDACIGEALLLWEAFEFLAGAAEVSEVAAVTTEGTSLVVGDAAATSVVGDAAASTVTMDVGTGTLVSSTGTGTVATCVASIICGGAATATTVTVINEVHQHLPSSQQQAEHTKGKRKSTEAKHEKGNSRRSQD